MNHDLYNREDGLSHCKVCGGAEGTLPTDCPGFRLSRIEQEAIWHGTHDYRDGAWVMLPPRPVPTT